MLKEDKTETKTKKSKIQGANKDKMTAETQKQEDENRACTHTRMRNNEGTSKPHQDHNKRGKSFKKKRD